MTANSGNEQMIRIELPDGSVREVAQGTTPHDVAMSISPRLAAAVVVVLLQSAGIISWGFLGPTA